MTRQERILNEYSKFSKFTQVDPLKKRGIVELDNNYKDEFIKLCEKYNWQFRNATIKLGQDRVGSFNILFTDGSYVIKMDYPYKMRVIMGENCVLQDCNLPKSSILLNSNAICNNGICDLIKLFIEGEIINIRADYVIIDMETNLGAAWIGNISTLRFLKNNWGKFKGILIRKNRHTISVKDLGFDKLLTYPLLKKFKGQI